ncbi:hypothetical protein ACI8AC_06505 [Geodermatophilus sp. SYSU D00758]
MTDAGSVLGAGVPDREAVPGVVPAPGTASGQTIPLSACTPVMDAVEPGVGILIGLFLSGEELAGGWRLAVAGVGVVVVRVGIVVLDTSPLTHRIHEQDAQRRAAPA